MKSTIIKTAGVDHSPNYIFNGFTIALDVENYSPQNVTHLYICGPKNSIPFKLKSYGAPFSLDKTINPTISLISEETIDGVSVYTYSGITPPNAQSADAPDLTIREWRIPDGAFRLDLIPITDFNKFYMTVSTGVQGNNKYVKNLNTKQFKFNGFDGNFITKFMAGYLDIPCDLSDFEDMKLASFSSSGNSLITGNISSLMKSAPYLRGIAMSTASQVTGNLDDIVNAAVAAGVRSRDIDFSMYGTQCTIKGQNHPYCYARIAADGTWTVVPK
jgi:hypothetical protein